MNSAKLVRAGMAVVSAALATLALVRSRPPAAAAPESDADVIWSIGKPDHSADEFAPGGASRGIVYEIGKDTPERGWRQRQDAAERDPAVSRVRFRLDQLPPAPPVLAVDCYFLGMGPAAVEITVNGKRGWFRVEPQAAPDLDERQANDINYSRQALRVPVDLSLLRQGENEIGIAFLGEGGGAYFDALSLRKSGGEGPDLSATVVPTIFFRERAGVLKEVTHVVLNHRRPLGPVELKLDAVPAQHPGDAYDFGERVVEIEVPAAEAPRPYTLSVTADGKTTRFTGQFQPEKRWRLFAGLKIHNDIGFTDQQENVHELDLRNTDRALELLAQFPFWKFNLETTWLVDNYMRSRGAVRRRQLVQSALANRMGVSALYLNIMSGISTGEEMYRTLYYARSLQKKYGIPMKFACVTDTPSHTWFIPSLLADAGIKGFANSSNQSRGAILQHSRLNEDSPFYWEGPDGKRVMTWMARSYHQLSRLVGRKPSVDSVRRTLPQFLARYRRADYPVDAVLLYGLYTDNAEIRDGEAAILKEWAQAYAYPKITPATDSDYYAYISERFASKLPVFRGDAGAYWEDGAASSAAETTLNRHSQVMLPAAELAHSLAAAFDGNVKYPAAEFQDAWRNLLFYDEHTWGAHNAISQPERESVADQWEYKRAYALRASMAAKELLRRGMNRLAQSISIDGSTLLVLNPDIWARTGPVEMELEPTRELFDPATGQAVPVQVLAEKTGYRKLRFLAADVPGLGYRAYGLRPVAAKPAPAPAPAAGPWQIESRHYRVVIDRRTGAIAQLIDKALNRDLVDSAAPHRLNELLTVTGGENSLIIRSLSNLAPPKLTVAGQEGAEVLENTGARIRIRARAPHVPVIETEIILDDGLKRVEIVNRLRKDAVTEKEAIYFAFPFRASPPELAYQVQNAWVRPNTDQLPGACRDWFTTQNLVVARDAGAAIAWATPDAPLVTLTDINRGAWYKHLPITNAHVYSYAMNNYWFTNYRASQGGDMTFRFFITSAASLAPSELARFDQETRSPLVAYAYLDTPTVKLQPAKRRMPRGRGAFLEIDAPNAQMTAWKQAEDGNGFILRLRETAGQKGVARIHSPVFALAAASLTNGVEADAAPLVVRQNRMEAPLRPNGFTTVRMVFK